MVQQTSQRKYFRNIFPVKRERERKKKKFDVVYGHIPQTKPKFK